MTYVSSRVAKQELHVHENTLRTWANQGKIDHIVTPSGQRKYDVESLNRPKPVDGKKGIAYCRVSSQGQKDDLQRQIQHVKEAYASYEVVTDIASGLNYNRPGLRRVLAACLAGQVHEVVVAHKDRLSRFSFDLIKWLLVSHGVTLTVLNEEVASPQQEMVEDLMSIIHVFSCRLHGQRKYTKRARSESENSSSSKRQVGGDGSPSPREGGLEEGAVLEERTRVSSPMESSCPGATEGTVAQD